MSGCFCRRGVSRRYLVAAPDFTSPEPVSFSPSFYKSFEFMKMDQHSILPNRGSRIALQIRIEQESWMRAEIVNIQGYRYCQRSRYVLHEKFAHPFTRNPEERGFISQ